jgi:glycosyltransferase involved in cell wall biosynthesis
MTTPHLTAVATSDPFDHGTFSGLSANLFEALRARGISVSSVVTKDIRWHDVLHGAVKWSSALWRPTRSTSRINVDWYWSRRTNELMTRRFEERLSRLGASGSILQVGTHVQASQDRRQVFCITDLTVIQAVESDGLYQVARASRTVQQEAISWQREVFDGCAKIFALSQWAADSIVSDYAQDRDRVVVTGAGANIPSLPEDVPRRDGHSILFVGLDWEQKGGPLLLDAFRVVRSRMPEARLVIVGCSPPIGDEPGVEIVGRLDRSDPTQESRLFDTYSEAACFCIAPRVDAFPNVLLEAAAFGLPCVSTNEGSRPELIIDGVTGRLVPPNDPQALGEALCGLLGDPGVAERLGRAGRERIVETFTWPRVADRVAREMNLLDADG